MSYFESYISQIANQTRKKAVVKVAEQFNGNILSPFNFRGRIGGVMLEDKLKTQTLKTLGLITTAADAGFDTFLLLTVNDVDEYKQVFADTLEYLSEFCVCNQFDRNRFLINKMRQPAVIVVKRNIGLMKDWRNMLLFQEFYLGSRHIFIINDNKAVQNQSFLTKQTDAPLLTQYINDIRYRAFSSIDISVVPVKKQKC